MPPARLVHDLAEFSAGIRMVGIVADDPLPEEFGVIGHCGKVERPVNFNRPCPHAICVVWWESHRFSESVAIGVCGPEPDVKGEGVAGECRVDMEIPEEGLAFGVIAIAGSLWACEWNLR